MFYRTVSASFTEQYYITSVKKLAFFIFYLAVGIWYSLILNYHFNFDLKKYSVYWSLGPFGIGKWKDIKKLDRVATFLNTRKECEVNIWDIRNKKFKVAAFDSIGAAVSFGRELAEGLEIRFKERK